MTDDELIKLLMEIKGQLSHETKEIERRLARIEKNHVPPRKDPSDKNRALVIRVAYLKRNGLCPGCTEKQIIDQYGDAMPDLVIDHWFHRDKNGLEHIWPVCAECNEKLKDPAYHTLNTDSFRAFQRDLKAYRDKEAKKEMRRDNPLFFDLDE